MSSIQIRASILAEKNECKDDILIYSSPSDITESYGTGRI